MSNELIERLTLLSDLAFDPRVSGSLRGAAEALAKMQAERDKLALDALTQSGQLIELEIKLKMVEAERDEARGCPKGDNCACAIGSRHFWLEAFSDERDKLRTIEADVAKAMRCESLNLTWPDLLDRLAKHRSFETLRKKSQYEAEAKQLRAKETE